MKLNEKIISCRKKAGMSQVDLADALGVSRQSVSKWETGESNPEITKLPQMAKLFGVTTDWLLSEDEAIISGKSEASALPQWVDRLPGFLGSLVKKYGWIVGLRMAISGGLFVVMGFVARAMFHNIIFAFSGSTGSFGGFPSMNVMTGNMHSFENTAWKTVSLFTGFVIFLGLAALIAGAILAWKLKKWGKK